MPNVTLSRALLSRRQALVLGTVPRLVRVPESREPPMDCLRALRQLHPRTEMVQAAPGFWWLGVVADQVPAMEEGRLFLRDLREREAAGDPVRLNSWRKAHLMAQGFRLLASLSSETGGVAPTPSQCVNAIAPAVRSTYKQDEARQDALQRASDGTDRHEASDRAVRGGYFWDHAKEVFLTARRATWHAYSYGATVGRRAPTSTGPLA